MADKTALIIIDMQKGFIPLVPGSEKLIPAVHKLIELGRSRDWKIIFIERRHDKTGVDAEKFRQHFFTEGNGITVRDSPEMEMPEEIAPRPDDLVVYKTRFSAFFATNLDLILRRLGCSRVIICGIQYPNCIRATAVDALAMDYDVVICTDATGAASKAVEEANIFDLKNMGVRCESLAQIEAEK